MRSVNIQVSCLVREHPQLEIHFWPNFSEKALPFLPKLECTLTGFMYFCIFDQVNNLYRSVTEESWTLISSFGRLWQNVRTERGV
jgi:hypothetical protein